jgi:hypothetical protein
MLIYKDNSSDSITPHSHSIVFAKDNPLVFLRKNFLRSQSSRRSDRQIRMAFDVKEEFYRSENSSLTGTIGIDRTIS